MRFINNNLFPLLAALVVIIAASLWFALPDPPPPPPLPNATEPWSLPPARTASADQTGQAVQAITQRKLWGLSQAELASAAPAPPQWRIVGIARNGNDRFVLLAFEGKPVSQLTVGDALPDGLKIAKIEDDRFFVFTADKKKIVFGLHQNDPKK
jgi:hypothetical protein